MIHTVADHEAEFHDGGEYVGDVYPQLSENPLRSFTARIDSDDGGGAYTVVEQVWTGAALVDGSAPGQYYEVTAQDINSSTDGAEDDIVPCREEYDEDGGIVLMCDVSSQAADADEKVASQNGQTANYLGVVLQAADQWATVATSGANVNVGTGEPHHTDDPAMEITFGDNAVIEIWVGGHSTQAVTKIRIDSKGWTCAVYYDPGGGGAWYEWPDFSQAI